MSSLKKVASNSLLYTASSILLRASSIIFFPIFSLYLTKADYGILSITQTVGTFVTVFAGLELTRALTRLIFNSNEKEKYSENELIYTTLITALLFSFVIIIILSLSGSFLLKKILKDIPFFPYVFLFLLSIPLTIIINTCKAYLKATHKGMTVFALDMSFFGTNIIMNLLFVVVFKMNVLGIIISNLINSILFSTIIYFTFYRKFDFRLSSKALKESLRYALPLLPFVITGIALEGIDKFFLNSKYGASYSGIYYISITFATIFSAGKEAIINALTPWMFKQIPNGNELYLSKVISSVFIISGIAAIFISWFSKEILTLLSSNTDFIIAYKYIPFTVLGMYIIFLGQLYNIKTYYFGKYIKYMTATTVLGIIVDVVACYFLVERYGILGAVISRVLAYATHIVGLIILSRYEVDKKRIYNERILFTTLLLITIFIMLPLFDSETSYFFIGKITFFSILTIIAVKIIDNKLSIIEIAKGWVNKS